jgi:hypothetical protein
MRRKLRLVAVACAVAALAAVSVSTGPAAAATGNAIINDCQSHGRLTHSYSLQELRHALAVMPASVKQYTSCADVINQGILTVRAGKTTGPKGGGGSFLPTPVIVILVLLVLVGVTFGALAIRQRRAGPPSDGPPGGGAEPSAGTPPPGDEPS